MPASSRRDGPWYGRPGIVGGALLALLVVPLVVALIALRRPQWFPILDLAMTELRVRDFGTRRTPLIGLPGRIGTLAEQGSHPGPLSFWLLAPAYRLFGAGAWAMQVGTVVVHTAAVATALWIANRRGGVHLMVGVAAMLALLTRAYGAGTLTEPWNPYLPLLWWVVLLLAVWAVAGGDLPMLAVAAFAASVCAQTHAPYAGVTGSVAALAIGIVAIDAWQHRRNRMALAHTGRWVGTTIVVSAALWAAPVFEQLRRPPGNLSMLVDHFGSPSEATVGLRRGIEMVLLHLDPWRLLTEQQAATGSLVDASSAPAGSLAPGALVLLAWIASVIVAGRARHGALLRLHLVVGVALVGAVVSISRIFGQLWFYLMIWAWGITAVLLLAVGWTLATEIGRRWQPAEGVRAGRAGRIGAAALAGVTVLSAAAFVVHATDVEAPAPRLSATLGRLVGPTVEALEGATGPATGRAGRYRVTWSDALYIGSQGMGLLNELDRRGFDVGGDHGWRVPITRHRVTDAAEATAVVHLATGLHVERWRAKPDVIEIVTIDPRTRAEQVEYAELRAQVLADLQRLGLTDLLDDVDANLFAAAIDQRVPDETRDRMGRMLDLGQPTAVFLGPSDVGY